MPIHADDRRQATRAWLDMPEGSAALLAMRRRLLEAFEQVRQANSPEAREAALLDACEKLVHASSMNSRPEPEGRPRLYTALSPITV